MKTYEEWEKSGLAFDDYLVEPCEIDERLDMFIGDCIAPNYLGEGLTQGGDCVKQEVSPCDGRKLIKYYSTSCHVNGKYFYLGILPEFRR